MFAGQGQVYSQADINAFAKLGAETIKKLKEIKKSRPLTAEEKLLYNELAKIYNSV